MTTGNREAHGSARLRRWLRSPALRLTLALHATGVLTLALQPGLWAWVVTALVANHVVLIGGVFCLRGRFLGPTLSRLPAAVAGGLGAKPEQAKGQSGEGG